jgi:Flp pilus assembly pilin Flp
MIQSLSAWLDIKIDRRAVTGVEYGLIAGVIAATITLAVSFITIG